MTRDMKPYTKMLGGNAYIMVNGKVLMAHDGNAALSIMTEVLTSPPTLVRVKAVVITDKGEFHGHAESNLNTGSPQEKKTPLEVAETSAIGRALSFAGYAIEDGIASAEEIEQSNGKQEIQVSSSNARVRANEERYEKQIRPEPSAKQLVWTKLKAAGLTQAEAIDWAQEKTGKGIGIIDDADWESLLSTL